MAGAIDPSCAVEFVLMLLAGSRIAARAHAIDTTGACVGSLSKTIIMSRKRAMKIMKLSEKTSHK